MILRNQKINIATILPYKENYTIDRASAASLWVSEFYKKSKHKKTNIIYGHTKSKNFLTKNYRNINLKSIKSKTKVISCNTIRDKSNQSFSSRNFYLSKKDLDKARNITNLIIKFKKRLKTNRAKFSDIETLKKEIKKKGVKKVDYLEILNLNTLKTPKKTVEKFNIFSAYYINNIRLIDNV